MSLKNCTSCNETKPTSGFGKNNHHKDGFQHECKACVKIKNNAYHHSSSGLIGVIYGSQKQNSINRGHPPPDYTLQELRHYVYASLEFDLLYLAWIESGYDKMKAPSCDRKDDYLPYTLGNILRVCTWQENQDRSYADRRNGINNKLSKAVIQMTLAGEFIAEHHSMSNASRMVGCGNSKISACCSGKAKTAGGYRWMKSLGIPIANNLQN